MDDLDVTLIGLFAAEPRIGVLEASRRLARGWLPYVFYTDAVNGRGQLLYRRHDGDLGLVTPRSHR